MNLPKLPATTEPFLWGAVAGAIALAVFGFNWGGWVTGGTAENMALARADKATLASLVPICVAQFQGQKTADVRGQLAALKQIETWQQSEYILKNGWATMPGTGANAEPSRDVATGCAEALNKLTL